MSEFFDTAINFPFMQNAILAGILASLACGIVGTYVVVKKIGYLSGGIAHAVLGGMGVAFFLGKDPIHGALITSIIVAIIIGLVSSRAHSHEDTIIGAIWAVGMAIGIIFISKTPGYNVDLMSYLFGNILLVSKSNLATIFILDLIIIAIVILFYNRFFAVCFDEIYARIRGINVELTYLLLLCVIAITVVILIQIVGLILVIALLTIPAAIAGQFTRNLIKMMMISSVLGMVFTLGGLVISYSPNLPAGATIIVTAGTVYFLTLIVKGILYTLSKNKASQSKN